MMLKGNIGEESMNIMLPKTQLGTPKLRLKEKILFLSLTVFLEIGQPRRQHVIYLLLSSTTCE